VVTIWLCGVAFLAGFVDAVVGGGGLIQLPALLLMLPPDQSADIAAVLGTNKAASIFGTGMAVAQYAPRVRFRWHAVMPAASAAFVCSWLGAMAVSHLDRRVLEPLILLMLVGVTLYTYVRPQMGQAHAPALASHHERAFGVAMGVLLGFYDGFFGPGTGSFLIFVFIGVFGFDFLNASASAKVVNFATNLAAVGLFASTGRILYRYALPMAACQMVGSVAGTRLAVLKGNRFVRVLFLVLASVLIARLGWDLVTRAG
jgi:uncharacterized protein